jgi:tetratricopeptide (TPR) repeat protein
MKTLARITLVTLLVISFSVSIYAQGAAWEEWEELNKQSQELFQQGSYSEAAKVAQEALEVAENRFGPDHQNVGLSLFVLASIYQAQGRYAEAEPLLKRSVEIREHSFGHRHPLVGKSLFALASVYQAQGKHAEAKPLFKRALEMQEDATALNNLAVRYENDQGKYFEAELLYKRSLEIQEDATVLRNLALLYHRQGKYAEAESLYKRALAIKEKALGPDHKEVTKIRNNLAALHRAQAKELNDLAVRYHDQGIYAEAESLYKRALAILAIKEKALGPDHKEVTTVRNNLTELHKAQAKELNKLAVGYHNQGKYAEAEPLYKRALAMMEKALGPDHKEVTKIRNNLAALHRAQSKHTEEEASGSAKKLPLEWLVFIVLIVGSIIWGIFSFVYRRRKLKKREKSREKRAVRLKEFGPQIPFHSFPNEDLISKFKDSTGIMRWSRHDAVFDCFLGRGAMNLMEGNIGSIDFVTFEYEYDVEYRGGPMDISGSTTSTYWGTAILLQSDQLALPSLSWGRQGIQPGAPPKAKEEAGSKQCPTCGSWDVRGGAMDEWGGTGDWCDHCKKSLYKMYEEKVLKLLGLVSIDDLRGWTALASNTQLLLYREKVTVPAEKYQEFMEKALKIFQMFQSASQNLNEHV